MLTEITPEFWIDIDKILFIVKEKETGEWHLHLSPDFRAPHLIMSDDDMAKLRDLLMQQRIMPFAPGTCL